MLSPPSFLPPQLPTLAIKRDGLSRRFPGTPMVPLVGLEPTAYWLKANCSTTELQERIGFASSPFPIIFGADLDALALTTLHRKAPADFLTAVGPDDWFRAI